MSYIVINPLYEGASTTDIDVSKILHEAGDDDKYSLDTGNTDSTTNDNIDETDDDTKYSLDDGTSDDGNNDTSPDNPDDQTDDNASTGDEDADTTSDSDTSDNSADTSQDNNSEVKVLNLSEKDKQLNNLKLMRKFSALEDALRLASNNLTSKTSYSPKQTQIIDNCIDNLNDMIEDINVYMSAKFSTTYETNVTAYLTYLKRYKTIMELVRASDDL